MTETEVESAMKMHSAPESFPEPVGPTNSTEPPLRLGTTLVLGEPEVEKPLDDPNTKLVSAQQIAESQAPDPTEAAPVESGIGAQEVEVKPETEQETKLEQEPSKVEQPQVPEPSLSEAAVEVKETEVKETEVTEVKETEVKNDEVQNPPPQLPAKTAVPAVTRQDQEAFKHVVKASRAKKTGKTENGDKDHNSPGEEPAPRKRNGMKRPAAAPKRKASRKEDKEEEVESPLKPRNLAAELEDEKDEETEPETNKEKTKKRPAKAEVSSSQPVKAARKSKAQPKEKANPPDAAAEDTSGDMPKEIQALMGSKTTFAGRRCPKTKDAASRFAAMVATYKKKIEPLVDNSSFLQVGVYQIRGVVLVLSSKLFETT